jgi:hypothetical protein
VKNKRLSFATMCKGDDSIPLGGSPADETLFIDDQRDESVRRQFCKWADRTGEMDLSPSELFYEGSAHVNLGF